MRRSKYFFQRDGRQFCLDALDACLLGWVLCSVLRLLLLLLLRFCWSAATALLLRLLCCAARRVWGCRSLPNQKTPLLWLKRHACYK